MSNLISRPDLCLFLNTSLPLTLLVAHIMTYCEPSIYIFYISLFKLYFVEKRKQKSTREPEKNPFIYNPSALMNVHVEKSIWLYN